MGMQQETVSVADTQTQLATYLLEIRNGTTPTSALEFWLTSKTRYPSLCPLALDLVHTPASESCSERVFSVCGDLTSGKRNRTSTTLERRVFLKMNKRVLDSLQ